MKPDTPPASHELHHSVRNVERLLLVLESHAARVLSGEEPDVALMRSIAAHVLDYVPDLPGARELADDPLAFVAAVRRHIASSTRGDYGGDARVRARFEALAHEAGCDCDYE